MVMRKALGKWVNFYGNPAVTVKKLW